MYLYDSFVLNYSWMITSTAEEGSFCMELSRLYATSTLPTAYLHSSANWPTVVSFETQSRITYIHNIPGITQ